MPIHNHPGTYRSTVGGATATGAVGHTSNAVSTETNVPSQGGGGSHDHTLSLDLNYINMIIASRD